MGLAERRAQKEFGTNRLPGLLKQVNEAAGFDVPMNIKWDTLMVEEYAHMYNEAWAQVYFEPLIAAFKNITQDEIGREALQEGVKKVVIQNVGNIYYGDRWASLHEGTLTLDHLATSSNAHNIKERTDGLVAVLEKAL